MTLSHPSFSEKYPGICQEIADFVAKKMELDLSIVFRPFGTNGTGYVDDITAAIILMPQEQGRREAKSKKSSIYYHSSPRSKE